MTLGIFGLSTNKVLAFVGPVVFGLVKMYFCHVSFLSRCSTKYLTWSVLGTSRLLSFTGGHVPFFKVKVTLVDFASFTLIRRFSSYVEISLNLFRSNLDATSQKVPVFMPSDVGRSEVYIKLSKGPSMLPCGIPAVMPYRPESLFILYNFIFSL